MSLIRAALEQRMKERNALEASYGLEKKRMYATERDIYLRMHVAKDILGTLVTEFRPRLELAKSVDEVEKAREIIDESMMKVFFTIPQEQRLTVERNADAATYAVGVKTPGSVGARTGDTNWGLYLSYADIATLIGAAKDHCLTCMGTVQEQKGCELRKVFDCMGCDAEHVDG